MKNVFLLLFMVVITCSGFAQSKPKFVDLLMGKEQKFSKREIMNDIIANDETGFYALRVKSGIYGLNESYIVQHFDNSLKFTNQVDLDLKYEDKNKDLEGTVSFGDNIIILSSFTNKKVKIKYLFMQTLNRNTLKINEDFKKIGEINYEGESKYNSGSFGFNVSKDSTKLLIYYDSPYEKKENVKYGFNVFDVKMNLLWSKQVELPYIDKLFDVEDYIVDNGGDVHILGRLYEDNLRVSKGGKPNYKFILLSYFAKDDSYEEYEISLKSNFITDLRIAFDDNNLICAGFYSENSNISIKGSFFFTVDANSKIMSDISLKEFSLDFITQNLTEKQTKKINKKDAKGKDVEMYKYDLNELVLRDDGGVVLIGEQFDIQIVTNITTNANGNKTTTYTYYYLYNDIIVVNINPDGKIDWAQKIAKRQKTRNDFGYFSSYALAVSGNKMYFTFNDNAKNLYYKGVGKVQVFGGIKNALAVLVVVDNEGNQTREALFGTDKKSAVLRPKISRQIDKNSLLVYCVRNKLEKFVKITAR